MIAKGSAREEMKMSQRTEEKAGRRSSLKNVKWVSHYLGVSRNTIHQWVLEGHIPYINLGVNGGRRIIRFDPELIEAWLIERSYAPVPGQGGGEPGKDASKPDDREVQ
jgi:excisionase family DNA binding protein